MNAGYKLSAATLNAEGAAREGGAASSPLIPEAESVTLLAMYRCGAPHPARGAMQRARRDATGAARCNGRGAQGSGRAHAEADPGQQQQQHGGPRAGARRASLGALGCVEQVLVVVLVVMVVVLVVVVLVVVVVVAAVVVVMAAPVVEV